MNRVLLLLTVSALGACATAPRDDTPDTDLGLLWVKHAAEYRALTRQAYATAIRDLPRFVDDRAWNALPQQRDAESLPPAVILDVDETVVSNVDFQMNFVPPFTNEKHDEWNRTHDAIPVDGAKEFIDAARALGVAVFFVTNRPCRAKRDTVDPCPQRQTTIGDLREVGIEADPSQVLLSEERGWTREKLSRRLHVARTHRVIMLFGDDYGDFVECSREKPALPCQTAATAVSRAAALDAYDHYWGNGWYVLPNPMHGSWTSFLR
ncbi:MAG: HAD family acid phosphatase [Woeseiaceae bacterium]|nr:HAD family acid phosphatase [Woeseiaceae bacterium]